MGRKGHIAVQKGPVPASEFVTKLSMSRHSPVAILHTRLATQGSQYNNLNNHPVRSGTVVGTHNGMVWNDDSLFAEVNKLVHPNGGTVRQGKVDSEAIFAAIAYKPALIPVLESITGSAAIAWLDERDENPNTLHLARIDSSPLLWAKYDDFIIYASTMEALDLAAQYNDLGSAELVVEAEEGEYFRFVDGKLDSKLTFEAADSYTYRFPRSYSYTPQSRVVSTRAIEHMVKELDWPSGLPLPSCDEETSAPLSATALNLEGVDLGEMLVVGNRPKRLTAAAYYARYDKREDAIDAHLVSSTARGSAEQAILMHALARPGDWVKVYSENGPALDGTIVSMPQSFPGGHYVLRVSTFNEARFTSAEPVLMAKRWHEFRSDNVAGNNYPLAEVDRLMRPQPAQEELPLAEISTGGN